MMGVVAIPHYVCRKAKKYYAKLFDGIQLPLPEPRPRRRRAAGLLADVEMEEEAPEEEGRLARRPAGGVAARLLDEAHDCSESHSPRSSRSHADDDDSGADTDRPDDRVAVGEDIAPVPGGGDIAPGAGGGGFTPVAGDGVITPVAGGGDITPCEGGGGFTPVADDGVITPVAGGGDITPGEGGGGGDIAPVAGGGDITPVAGGGDITPVADGGPPPLPPPLSSPSSPPRPVVPPPSPLPGQPLNRRGRNEDLIDVWAGMFRITRTCNKNGVWALQAVCPFHRLNDRSGCVKRRDYNPDVPGEIQHPHSSVS